MSWIFGKRKTPAGEGRQEAAQQPVAPRGGGRRRPTHLPLRAELLRENKRMLDKAIRELDRERMGLQQQEKKLVMEIKKMAKEGQMEAVKVMAKSLVRNRHAVNKMFALKSQLQAVSLRIAVRGEGSAGRTRWAGQGAVGPLRWLDPPAGMWAGHTVFRPRQCRSPAHTLSSALTGPVALTDSPRPWPLAPNPPLQTLKSTHAMAQAMQGATKAMGAMNRRMNMPALAKIMREFERQVGVVGGGGGGCRGMFVHTLSYACQHGVLCSLASRMLGWAIDLMTHPLNCVLQNEKMEMTSEMMGDAVDGVFEEGGEEEETDELVNQVGRGWNWTGQRVQRRCTASGPACGALQRSRAALPQGWPGGLVGSQPGLGIIGLAAV